MGVDRRETTVVHVGLERPGGSVYVTVKETYIVLAPQEFETVGFTLMVNDESGTFEVSVPITGGDMLDLAEQLLRAGRAAL